MFNMALLRRFVITATALVCYGELLQLGRSPVQALDLRSIARNTQNFVDEINYRLLLNNAKTPGDVDAIETALLQREILRTTEHEKNNNGAFRAATHNENDDLFTRLMDEVAIKRQLIKQQSINEEEADRSVGFGEEEEDNAYRSAFLNLESSSTFGGYRNADAAQHNASSSSERVSSNHTHSLTKTPVFSSTAAALNVGGPGAANSTANRPPLPSNGRHHERRRRPNNKNPSLFTNATAAADAAAVEDAHYRSLLPSNFITDFSMARAKQIVDKFGQVDEDFVSTLLSMMNMGDLSSLLNPTDTGGNSPTDASDSDSSSIQKKDTNRTAAATAAKAKAKPPIDKAKLKLLQNDPKFRAFIVRQIKNQVAEKNKPNSSGGTGAVVGTRQVFFFPEASTFGESMPAQNINNNGLTLSQTTATVTGSAPANIQASENSNVIPLNKETSSPAIEKAPLINTATAATDADSESESDASSDTDTTPTAPATDTDSESEPETDSNTGSGLKPNPNPNTDTGSDSDTSANTDTNTDSKHKPSKMSDPSTDADTSDSAAVATVANTDGVAASVVAPAASVQAAKPPPTTTNTKPSSSSLGSLFSSLTSMSSLPSLGSLSQLATLASLAASPMAAGNGLAGMLDSFGIAVRPSCMEVIVKHGSKLFGGSSGGGGKPSGTNLASLATVGADLLSSCQDEINALMGKIGVNGKNLTPKTPTVSKREAAISAPQLGEQLRLSPFIDPFGLYPRKNKKHNHHRHSKHSSYPVIIPIPSPNTVTNLANSVITNGVVNFQELARLMLDLSAKGAHSVANALQDALDIKVEQDPTTGNVLITQDDSSDQHDHYHHIENNNNFDDDQSEEWLPENYVPPALNQSVRVPAAAVSGGGNTGIVPPYLHPRPSSNNNLNQRRPTSSSGAARPSNQSEKQKPQTESTAALRNPQRSPLAV